MSDEARRQRAMAREAQQLPGRVVTAPGTPKALYSELSLRERFFAMRELCVRQWEASGKELPKYRREEAPGEIFTI